MYEVRLSRRAENYYQRVDPGTAGRLNQVFEELSDNPYRASNVRPLRGRQNLFRYRLGELRVVFMVDQAEQVVRVLAIGPRGDIY